MTPQEKRCCAAELIGTFAIVFFGCGSIVLFGKGGGVAGHLGVNVVFGAIVAAMIYSVGHISCAHFNPAVTLGFLITRRFAPRMVFPYLVAQFVGAIAACGCLAVLLPVSLTSAAHFGATISNLPPLQTMVMEAILTFFLMFVIMAVATEKASNLTIAGLSIGVTVMLCGMFGGIATGCSMNPARSLAPALFSGGIALGTFWLYAVGSIVGAMLGAVAYESVRAPRNKECLLSGQLLRTDFDVPLYRKGFYVMHRLPVPHKEYVLETIASLSREDASDLIRRSVWCPAEEAERYGYVPSKYEQILHRDLFLAAHCLGIGAKVDGTLSRSDCLRTCISLSANPRNFRNFPLFGTNT